MSEERRAHEEEAPEHSRHGLTMGYYVAAVVLIFGASLVLYGILGPASQTQKGLGYNLTLWWGLSMVAFGCAVLGLSWALPRRRAARQRSSSEN